jgi:hypothetical protein
MPRGHSRGTGPREGTRAVWLINIPDARRICEDDDYADRGCDRHRQPGRLPYDGDQDEPSQCPTDGPTKEEMPPRTKSEAPESHAAMTLMEKSAAAGASGQAPPSYRKSAAKILAGSIAGPGEVPVEHLSGGTALLSTAAVYRFRDPSVTDLSRPVAAR